ncbi:hypothetical protein J132_05631 [Termitomyces sp. J132]|nr:hypothetical protein C0989_005906 [Termitomyces sp. Mn162]KNZ80511.1 hypothetical protein J132_05631 [Termitomyces sp. J132]
MSDNPKYIVVFKKNVTKEQIDKYADEVNNNGGKVTNVYESVLNGFAAHLPDSYFQSLQADDVIDYIGPYLPLFIHRLYS